MRVRYWLGRLGMGLLALLVLLTAYGYYATREQPIATRRVTLNGELLAAQGVSGKVQVRVFQAWAGQGALRHPLEAITTFPAPLGSFRQEIDYPVNDGEGLVIYAWLDSDGDGHHCTPTVRNDPAGLTQVSEFPVDSVSFRLELNQPCVGPEHFFPR